MLSDLFPHDSIRDIQKELMNDVKKAIETKSHLIAHAPTGLGKTAATLPIALAYAKEHKKTVFFLTSRHTQHTIAIETLKAIKEKHGISIVVADLIAKKWMCIQPGVSTMYAHEFREYCKHLRENMTCEFYERTKKNGAVSMDANATLAVLHQRSPLHITDLIETSKQAQLCPYEMAMELSKNADVVIADYFYIFNPSIQESFFAKTGIRLEDAIIIVDEAHNLPARVRELLTHRLSLVQLQRAVKEADKYKYEDTLRQLIDLQRILSQLYTSEDERLVRRSELITAVAKSVDYDQLVTDFETIADAVRGEQRQSFIGGVAQFLDAWRGEDDGFARILQRKGDMLTLSYRCLDPDVITSSIISQSHSTIVMSGTLTPTSMFREILGFPSSTEEKVYASPFPQENKLAMIIPQTSTKFTLRSDSMYKKIADILAKVTNAIPGNSAVFFPSYDLRNKVSDYFSPQSFKTQFSEESAMQNHEKEELLSKFKQYKTAGAVLLGVSAGNFSEGIDLPGDLLRCVVIVGLPLQRPDLETKELIQYYDKKFSKGWDYGYLFPAFNKCLQGAGRCIRSGTDRGVIIFLDDRFSWPNYHRCFPKDMNVKISMLYEDRIKRFFQD